MAARRPTKITAAQKERFLDALREGQTISESCKAGPIGRSTAFRLRQSDEEFAVDWHDAVETGTDRFEAEARRRAVDGTERPIMYRGEVVTTVREYSDRMLELMLKARRPERFRERVDHRVAISPLSPEQLRQAREAGLDPEVEAAAAKVAAIPVVLPEQRQARGRPR